MNINIVQQIKQHCIDFVSEDEFLQRFQAKKKLRIKLGADPTAPDLHLGHAVVLHKLKLFQDLGHDIIFVIGDFTAMIGDPSGRSKVRKPLSMEEIKNNAKTYFQQVSSILDISKTEIRYNSEWLSSISMAELVKIMSNFTLSQILARDDFSKRYRNNQPIYFHEFLYPLMQAYDSVAIHADVELGGSDQTFNLLLGREMQLYFCQDPQIILTMPLLVGLDGTAKMSKSLNNYIGITENAQDIFGKTMSIPDHLIVPYFELVLFYTSVELDQIKQRLSMENPMEIKMELAFLITEKYSSSEAAQLAKENFIRIHRNKEKPEEWIELVIEQEKDSSLFLVLYELGISKSKSEARRLIEQGGVMWNNEKMNDPHHEVRLANETHIKVGKRLFYRIVIR